MNAQAAALGLVQRETTLGAVVESSPKIEEFSCVDAQVNNSRLPGACFDVDVPLPGRQIEDTDSEVVSAT
ncbi:MAG: hypothetical protein M0R28_24205 [Pigmentiphaga sp.]|nr:hypothetical protein [Pigmentiphaga sp.]